VRRREQGTPLEHVLGFALFAGTQVAVDPAVFVPRRRAEPLVDLCVTAARSVPTALVVDLGCGSGAIAAAVSARLRRGTVVAVDADPVAVACARRNGAEHGFEVYTGDWFDGCRPATRAGSTSQWRICRTCRSRPSTACRPTTVRPSRWPPWTAALTGWTRCARCSTRRRGGCGPRA
jgi:hypothetical protein